jgi:cob(I)alamin adenosyltransferase
VQPQIVPYLNRLSDVLWLFSRLIEHNRMHVPLSDKSGASARVFRT